MCMTNQHLIHIGAELFKRMSKPIRQVINDSGLETEEIDRLILVGGSSRMPIVSRYLDSLVDILVVTDEQPDESIALGAGIAAAIKERTGDVKDMILADICPFSLGTELYDGSFSPIIHRNDTLPCSKTESYVTVKDNQTTMEFPIYQGDNLIARENLLLGTMEVTNLPKAPKGAVWANVTFLYDINGILDIRITSRSQTVHRVMMNKRAGLSEDELNRRLEELRQMTLSPMEDEKNLYLMEKAQRLYRECSPALRGYLSSQLMAFRRILETGGDREIREAYVRFSLYLEAVERSGFDFEAFDDSFFEDDMEEKDLS